MFQYAVVTDKGGREVNEDAVGVFHRDGNDCFVLCDGLGGHGMGDVASNTVKEVFENLFSGSENVKGFLTAAFLSSQKRLLEEQEKLHAQKKMKTTCVSLVTDGKYAYIGHIGDSRLYVFYRGKVAFRTLDHSIPQMLVLSKEIKESEIRFHKSRNIVMRVLGNEWEEPQYELMKPVPLKKCQAFLLCSDGFWELINEDEMCSALKGSRSPEQWLAEMEKTVRENGKDRDADNYSAIAVLRV